MAANVRFRGVYYNTPNDGSPSSTLRVDICDTEPVSQIHNFQLVAPDESYEGLNQDLKPGVYPSSFKFRMAIRSSPKVVNGTTMGITDTLISDIMTAAEGRFIVKKYRNDILEFAGPMIYDQCSWEDFPEPYFLNVTAVDGMARWNTEDYISEVGQIVYYSTDDVSVTYDTTPIPFDGPETTAWVMIENWVKKQGYFFQITTYARRETYSKNSPGDGWTDIGSGKWVKAVSYTNEEVNETVNVEYRLTRDIDDDLHRTVSEYFKRAIVETNMTGEYISPAVMYDVSCEWYEHSMDSLTNDPTTQMRLHEGPLIGKTWMDAMQEICRLLNMRIYYSKGRYHFEQISMRDDTTIKRFIYQADGTSAGAAETASLDLDFSALEIDPLAGGQYKILAPFKSVEAYIQLDRSDLLKDIRWYYGSMGEKYLGRIKRGTGTQAMVVKMSYAVTSTFSTSVLSVLDPALVNNLCKHKIITYTQIRLTNLSTSAVYYLTQDGNDYTWESTEYTIERSHSFGVAGYIYSADNYGYTRNGVLQIQSENIPDPADAMFDVHVSVTFGIEWDNANAESLWDTYNPTLHWHTYESRYPTPGDVNVNSMRFYSDVTTTPFTEHPDTIDQKKTVFVENDTDNSVKVKIGLQWADTNQFEKAIQIYDGADWVNSAAWSINGTGSAVEIMELLVNEVASFRTLPRRLYSGSFASIVPSAENRLLRGTYYYLPLSCNKDSDLDTFQGDFLEISRTTPPTVGTINDYTDGGPIGGPTGIGDSNPDAPTEEDQLYFETNEVITAGVSITEVDIVNTQGWSIAAGNTVKILNLDTNASETVTLTADVDPGDTVMYFTAYSFLNTYPDASPIIINAIETPGPTDLNKYFYSNRNYTGQYHVVSQFPFSVLNGMNNNQRTKKVKITRNGANMICVQGLTGLDPNPNHWKYSSDDDRFDFLIPLAGEEIIIDADLKR